jgi:predicted enzyme related to lactoylglutathione lyase
MSRHSIVLVLAMVAASVSVPAQSARRPGTEPTAGVGAFVWHDLVTPDPQRCRPFYSALFGWTFESGQGVDPGYTIIKHAGQQIGGIVQRKPVQGEDAIGQWLSYVVVADVDRATDAFRAAGGRVYRGPLNARKDLRIAVVADPQGAPLGLASRGPRVDTDAPPGVNRWLWMEYVARDPGAALSFYGEVVGYRHEVQDTRQNFTYYLLSTDRPRAGLFRSLWERDASAWLPYVRVEDPAAMAARAAELGGRILLPPAPSVRNGSLAIVLDPTGAAVALQKFPFESGATP